ncbi:MAG: class I fructose-bisphosphate aldolase family protein [Parcubacteria group bacterium]|nr:class I fructose-bisphosphate aldolase family protein [Parcubacteria group bacterium]
MIGKQIRMERIINRKTRKTVIIPMDHGVTIGPVKGLTDMGETVDLVAMGGANAVIGHIGLALHGHRGYGRDIGLILHLSASTSLGPDPNNKVLVNSVESAIKMGADGISIHVNVGAENEASMLTDLGNVAQQCIEWGMPLLAMMYARGHDIEDEKDVEAIKIAARVGAELGADIIKTVYTGTPESFAQVVEGCPVPVVIAGGSKLGDLETLKMVQGAMEAGANGLSIGRNAFQHEHPDRLVKAACAIVHEGITAEEAMKLLEIVVEVPEKKPDGWFRPLSN